MCREVCDHIASVNNQGQLISTDVDPVQIDELTFPIDVNIIEEGFYRKIEHLNARTAR